MHIHLINLDRSPERLTAFCDLNRHLTSVSRFPAIEGGVLNVDALVQQGLVTNDILSNGFFTLGALGCAISNIALWDRSIANNQMVTISEDDAIFNYDFEPCAEEMLKSLPTDWDIIYWGFNFDMFLGFDMLPAVSPCFAKFDQSKMRAGTEAFQKQSITPKTFKAIWVFGTLCYSISPKGAQVIKNKILPLRPKIVSLPEVESLPSFGSSWRTVGIDNCINAVHREIKSFVCFPPLVISKNEPDRSTVRSS